MPLSNNMKPFQNAWVVADLDLAVKHWIEVCQVGPFFVQDLRNVISDVKYRGEPGELPMKIALAQAGPVQIELIQPFGDSPNCYRDVVPPGESGFHHMCVWTMDFEADTRHFNELGYPTANEGRTEAGRFAYFDTRPGLNCMIEIVEHSTALVTLFEEIAQASIDWDGRDPIRG
jgi:hypothetical protein